MDKVTTSSTHTPRFLTRHEVAAALGISNLELHQICRKAFSKTYDPTFPKPLADGSFITAEIFDWRNARDARNNPQQVIYQRDRRSGRDRRQL